MGLTSENAVTDEAQKLPLLSGSAISSDTLPPQKIPEDSFNLCYIIYFTLGAGFLLPWNAFITAVDYFDYLYPGVSVDRVFSVAYMLVCLFSLLVIVLFYAHRSDAYWRINLGLGLFVVALLVVPAMDLLYIKGQTELYGGFYVTVGAVSLCGLADALVQGGLIGSAGELPERYMQATIAGTAASGVLVSFLRIFTKAVFPQNASGLRSSANLYFAFGIVLMVICIIFYNVAHKLPVIRYFNELKMQALTNERQEKGSVGGSLWRSTLWKIVGRVKWYGLGLVLVYMVTMSIFPVYVTEDVHSQISFVFLLTYLSALLISGFSHTVVAVVEPPRET